MKITRKNVISAVCILLLLSAISYIAQGFMHPAGNTLTRVQILQHESDIKLLSIADSISRYKTVNNGRRPNNLACLLDGSIDFNIDLLRVQRNPSSLTSRGRLNHNTFTEDQSDYQIPNSESSNVIIMEKPGLWKDGTVAVCYSNMKVSRLSKSKIFEINPSLNGVNMNPRANQ